MKFNKWTLGLAAIGVVSLASAAKADEKMSALQTALSSTTISGYVDTSIQWNPGTGNGAVAPVKFQSASKADGFNLNVVQLTIAKPLDEADWAAGYRADLWFGPDANVLGTQSVFGSGSRASQADLAIRQAYVALRMPIGNGLDWKVGVFDSVLGYESVESGNNPNYTRSYGHSIEPQTHTGVLATYRFNDWISIAAGIANTVSAAINERAHGPNTAANTNLRTAESFKTYMGSIALTAPDSWGWAKGSTLYGGVVTGFNGTGDTDDITENWYAGVTLATPVSGLKFGVAFDYFEANHFQYNADSVWAAAVYASYQATEKLSVHFRGEHLNGELPGQNLELWALTGTVQYDLWKNVISRLEIRWDHCGEGPGGNNNVFGGHTSGGATSNIVGNIDDSSQDFSSWHAGDTDETAAKDGPSTAAGDILGIGGTGTVVNGQENALMIALQIIYKF